MTFRLSEDVPETYEIKIGGLAGQFTVIEAAAPSPRSVTWSDAVFTKFFLNRLPDNVHFFADNKAAVEGGVLTLNLNVGVSEGKICFWDVPLEGYNLLILGLPDIKTYMGYDHGKIFLAGLPRWVDPRKEIAPDVDRLPFVDSVMTRKGEITWTYRWP